MFELLQQKTHVELENPTLTEIHKALVLQGDYPKILSMLRDSARLGHFQSFITDHKYRPQWQPRHPRPDPSAEGTGLPPGRGGHQAALDREAGKLYVFGGWDGERDLSDLWCLDLATDQWRCLMADTRK